MYYIPCCTEDDEGSLAQDAEGPVSLPPPPNCLSRKLNNCGFQDQQIWGFASDPHQPEKMQDSREHDSNCE